MTTIIELTHRTDPRYLRVATLPERVTLEDLATRRYGPALTVAPDTDRVVSYAQPGGPGTDWVCPEDGAAV